MKTFMVTVRSAVHDDLGLRIQPGIPMGAFSERPALKEMIQGCRLELRRPDGTTLETELLTYGIGVMRGPSGDLYVEGPPSEQPILLTLPSALSVQEVPSGTEIWLIADRSVEQ